MTVKLVVSREDVRERYVLQDRQDINDTVDSALRSAHLFFQGALGTEWNEALNQTDVFYLNRDMFAVYPNNQFRFRLKRAFVRNSPAVVVKYALRRRDLLDASGFAILDEDYYTVDYDKGIVFVDSDFDTGEIESSLSGWEDKRNHYFSITYSAGFDDEIVATEGQTDGTPAVVTVATYLPPDWLKEAILIWMGSVLAVTANTADNQAAINAAKEFKNQAEDMIAHKKRETAFQFFPIS